MQTESHLLHDDGCTPNHPVWPLVIYLDAFSPGDGTDDVIARFAGNGWRGAWVNGIYDFHHYHARSHEVLANLGVSVTVQFGGTNGPIIEFPRYAAVVIPAGGGHCRLSSGAGLVIVGAYPVGQEEWDLKRADNPTDYRLAMTEISQVPRPGSDPVAGQAGPLLDHWTE